MAWKLRDIFPEADIDGDANQEFDEVAVTSGQVSPAALYLVLEQDYLSGKADYAGALQNGLTVAGGQGPRPQALQGRGIVTWVRVDNPAKALEQLAVLKRDASLAKRIGITGSSGKTTTKDLIAHLLRLRFKRTLKSVRNYNGELGVPLTLRKLRPDDQFLVAEVGMGDAGSMRRRSALVRPHVAVVTNVGVSHIVRFGSREAIAAEKAELVRALMPGGLAVLNGDDPYCRQVAGLDGHSFLFFGLGKDNDVFASRIEQGIGGIHFTLHYREESVPCYLPLLGEYQVYNALAAVCVALWAGLQLEEIAERLNGFKPGEQRGSTSSAGGMLIVDEGYNSNPLSVRAAVEMLQELPAPSRWLVLGDMQPLGELTDHYYQEIGDLLANSSLTGLVLVGSEVKRMLPQLQGRVVFAVDDAEAAVGVLLEWLKPGSAVVLKAQDDVLFTHIRRLLLERLHDRS